MRTKRRSALAAGVAAATLFALLPALTAAPAASADTLGTYHQYGANFPMTIGTPAKTCTINASVYIPDDATTSHPVPAMILAHGFGADKGMFEKLAQWFAGNGYAVVNYTNIGSMSSDCGTDTASQNYEGAIASRFVDYLGGDPVPSVRTNSITDSTPATPAAGAPPMAGIIIHDPVDHDGLARPDDPRVGMLGVSLGGGTTFAAAAVDHRIDTIIPGETWNNLNYSLGPNNADSTSPTDLVSPTPGAAKTSWEAALAAYGYMESAAQLNLLQILACPLRTLGPICGDMVQTVMQGYDSPKTIADLDDRSVSTYSSKIVVPTLLLAGEQDDLFNLKEPIANYEMLQKQGTPVKMIWSSGEHGAGVASGDINITYPDTNQYTTKRVLDWMDYYLKGDTSKNTGPAFAYLKPWLLPQNWPVSNDAPTAAQESTVTAAYATSDTAAVPAAPHTWYLSGGGRLTDDATKLTTDSQTFNDMGTPLYATLGDVATWGSHGGGIWPDSNLVTTVSGWTSPALAAPVTVFGEPTVDVRLAAPAAAANIAQYGVGGMVVCYAKIYDIDANGNPHLVQNMAAPFRVSDVSKPVHVVLPPITHQFPAGDKIQLLITGYDTRFGGSQGGAAVTITSGDTGQGLTLPTVNP
ncbi:putative acyl esterase [Catenulispora sp. MAP12-49]|uniref:CocE/NonD family hydrolase n=1 Tax=Catenulispora sp. MAP12-49 TaxID=3156302 RepID=UPI003513D5B1